MGWKICQENRRGDAYLGPKSMCVFEEERRFGSYTPRKFFKTTPFTLAINVTDALFKTTVVLENR